MRLTHVGKMYSKPSQTQYQIPLTDNIFEKVPNGGVLSLVIATPEGAPQPRRSGGFLPVPENDLFNSGDSATTEVHLERLIFIKPKSKLPFTITTDQEEYQPGDKVDLQVTLDDSTNEDE